MPITRLSATNIMELKITKIMDAENFIKQLNILFISNHIDRYVFELLSNITKNNQTLQLQQDAVSGWAFHKLK